jgi:hypothetical protein
MRATVPPLLRRLSSDEYAPLPRRPVDERAIAIATAATEHAARALRMTAPEHAADRRGTAASLRAIDQVHGGGFYDVPSSRCTSSQLPTPRLRAAHR